MENNQMIYFKHKIFIFKIFNLKKYNSIMKMEVYFVTFSMKTIKKKFMKCVKFKYNQTKTILKITNKISNISNIFIYLILFLIYLKMANNKIINKIINKLT